MPSRCFLAIDLSEPCRRMLSSTREAFLDADPSWAGEKWVRSASLHVTVKFIGPMPRARFDETVYAASEATASRAPFEMTLSDVRAIPSQDGARMIWAGLDGDIPSAAALAGDIDLSLATHFGTDREQRPFAAHVTLARARKMRPVLPGAVLAATGRIDAAEPSVRKVSVSSVTLYSSTLSPQGPRYEAIATIPLAGGGCQTDRV